MNCSTVRWRAVRAGVVLATVLLAGCSTPLERSDYAVGYRPLSLNGVGGAAHGVGLVPDACLQDDVAAGDRTLLPAGCANAMNLREMVANPSELTHGTPMGPGFAAPVGQAVERYLRAGEFDARRPVSDEQRRRRLDEEGRTSE